jgi:hypothetical protein
VVEGYKATCGHTADVTVVLMSVVEEEQKIFVRLSYSAFDPGCVKTPTSNLRVEIFVSITLNRKRTALAVTVEGGQGRKQFCAFSARARFHTAWTQGIRIGARF